MLARDTEVPPELAGAEGAAGHRECDGCSSLEPDRLERGESYRRPRVHLSASITAASCAIADLRLSSDDGMRSLTAGACRATARAP